MVDSTNLPNADINQIATDLNGKADRDLVNLSDSGLREFYFLPGDTYSFSYSDLAPCVFGLISNSKKDITFSIVLPKRLDKITTVTINELKTNLRHSSGGYVPNSSYVSGGENLLSHGTVSVMFLKDSNLLNIKLSLTTAASSVTNNTPICGTLNTLSLTFS